MAEPQSEVGARAERGRGGRRRETDACIAACSTCQRVCLEAARACLQTGGVHANAEHVTLLLDCAQMCATNIDFMERGSEYHVVTCSACAEICRACSRSCREVGGNDMERCAQVCDNCAASCEETAKRVRIAAQH